VHRIAPWSSEPVEPETCSVPGRLAFAGESSQFMRALSAFRIWTAMARASAALPLIASFDGGAEVEGRATSESKSRRQLPRRSRGARRARRLFLGRQEASVPTSWARRKRRPSARGNRRGRSQKVEGKPLRLICSSRTGREPTAPSITGSVRFSVSERRRRAPCLPGGRW
jgi:hypothetical protein